MTENTEDNLRLQHLVLRSKVDSLGVSPGDRLPLLSVLEAGSLGSFTTV